MKSGDVSVVLRASGVFGLSSCSSAFTPDTVGDGNPKFASHDFSFVPAVAVALSRTTRP